MIGWLTAPLRRRRVAKDAARQARADLHTRVRAIVDGYDHPELAPAMERVAAAAPGTRRRRRPSRVVALLAAGVLATTVAVVGVLAFYTATGSGTGAAAVSGTVQPLVFTPGTAVSPLYPGGSGDVDLTVANPNGFSVHIPSLALDTSQGGGSGFAASGCPLGQARLSFTATPQNNGGAGWTVPANASAFHINLPTAVSMATNAASSCQSATFTVFLKVGP